MSVKLLWIEEEIDTLRWERLFVTSLNWSVRAVSTVADGMQALADEAFDIVFVDLILPADAYTSRRGEVDPDAGIGLVSAIRDPNREGATPPDVPMVIISAIVSPELKAQVVSHLATPLDYLTKPVDEQSFRQMIERVIHRLGLAAQSVS